jgi:hypothetical protein
LTDQVLRADYDPDASDLPDPDQVGTDLYLHSQNMVGYLGPVVHSGVKFRATVLLCSATEKKFQLIIKNLENQTQKINHRDQMQSRLPLFPSAPALVLRSRNGCGSGSSYGSGSG